MTKVAYIIFAQWGNFAQNVTVVWELVSVPIMKAEVYINYSQKIGDAHIIDKRAVGY